MATHVDYNKKYINKKNLKIIFLKKKKIENRKGVARGWAFGPPLYAIGWGWPGHFLFSFSF